MVELSTHFRGQAQRGGSGSCGPSLAILTKRPAVNITMSADLYACPRTVITQIDSWGKTSANLGPITSSISRQTKRDWRSIPALSFSLRQQYRYESHPGRAQSPRPESGINVPCRHLLITPLHVSPVFLFCVFTMMVMV